MLYSEVFTVFLVSLLVYFLTRAFTDDAVKTKKYLYLSGFVFGYIALTKIIFGYVLLFMLIGSAVLWLMKRQSVNYRKGIVISLLAFATVIPYLSYTYYLTGRLFYWGTTGGNNLYWMSSLSEDEYGSWFPDPATNGNVGIPLVSTDNGTEKGGAMNLKNRTTYIPGAEDSIRKYHLQDFEEINKFTGPERDDAYKKIVMKNIKANPVKFIKNCISNVGRILFNYPYSYTPQKPGTLFRLPLNGIIVILSLFCLIPTLLNWRKIIYPARFMLMIALLYLGGSVFGSAEIRMFTIVVPLLLFWIAYILQRAVKVKLKFTSTDI
jgi:4-amino-4-deoxy-L-arabinose transferase-like glycosyltransferase